ncbi:MAG: tetratricopeptide repeat protein [Candidatus Stahlbacteria bacterium]|nr:MAG: tetratricopeptide repeat protein [Candidatus Stahlbacteria bacterium]
MVIKGKSGSINKILARASELEANGKINKAIEELQKAIKDNVKDGNLYNRLGDLYVKSNKTKESIDAYKKSVEAFRNDTFYRNALALCKKILRYDPDNIETYLTTAELLVDLDEKSDALIYFFEYIEKQLAENNIEEVLKTLKYVEKQNGLDGKMIKKITETYKTIGKDDLVKKFAAQITKDSVVQKEMKVSKIASSTQKLKKEPVVEKDIGFKNDTIKFDKEEKRLKDNIAHLDVAVNDIESAISQLRKAIRLDEVIIALDKSLTTLSNEHKKAIALLQKSLSLNLETLQKSIKELDQGSEKNIKSLDTLLNNLNKALEISSKNQASFTRKIDDNFKNLSNNFNSTTTNALKEIKSALSDQRKGTDDICRRLEETKDCNVSLLKVSEETKSTLQKINNSIFKFILAEEGKTKKLKYYAIIIISIITAICGLFVFSILK